MYKCEYRELVKQLYSETYGKGPYKKRMDLERTASRYTHILFRENHMQERLEIISTHTQFPGLTPTNTHSHTHTLPLLPSMYAVRISEMFA